MKVEIISKRLVAPSSPTPSHLQTMKTSFFDELLPPNYVSCILYYPATATPSSTDRSELLRNSLSQTLTLFYPLGGRYIASALSVNCNDEGAEYVEAKVSGNLSEILSGQDLDMALLTQLSQYPYESDTSPLLVVQFNVFECGGAAIGISFTHRLADGFSFFMFLDAWATTCRIGVEKVLQGPTFTMGSICPPRGTSPLRTAAPSEAALRQAMAKRTATKRVVIDGDTISSLKGLVLKATRVEIAAAFLWRAMIMASKAKHGSLRPSVFSLPVNLRGRTSLPIPEQSFGNVFVQVTARYTPNDEVEGKGVQLHELVGLIQEAKQNSVAKFAEASSAELAFMAGKNMEVLLQTYMKKDADPFTLTSWCRFPSYEADFGWGKPEWVSCAEWHREVVVLMDAKDGVGVEAWVSLDEALIPSLMQNLHTESPSIYVS